MEEEILQEMEKKKKKKKRKPILIGILVFVNIILLFFAIIGIMTTVFAAQLLKYPTQLQAVMDTYNLVENYYYEPVDQGNLIEGLAAGMVDSLGDPYSVYYTKDEYTALNESLSGLYSGVGIIMTQNADTGYIEITKVFKGSPAESAGIVAGDIIQSVDGETVSGKTLDEVSASLKGETGTSVEVTIYRASDSQEHTYSVVRQQIQTPTVEGTYLESEPTTYYVTISSFTNTTGEEFQALIESLDKKPENIILDLRNNGGGMVNAAVDVASFLIPGGVVMYESGRDNVLYPTEVGNDKYLGIPIVVLVNGNTASSSEILAGAIQDHESGELVGETTYGKGVVQSIINMPTGGGLKLTTRRYLTPDKQDINGVGLTPNVTVEMTNEDKQKIDYRKTVDEVNDPYIQEALKVLGE